MTGILRSYPPHCLLPRAVIYLPTAVLLLINRRFWSDRVSKFVKDRQNEYCIEFYMEILELENECLTHFELTNKPTFAAHLNFTNVIEINDISLKMDSLHFVHKDFFRAKPLKSDLRINSLNSKFLNFHADCLNSSFKVITKGSRNKIPPLTAGPLSPYPLPPRA